MGERAGQGDIRCHEQGASKGDGRLCLVHQRRRYPLFVRYGPANVRLFFETISQVDTIDEKYVYCSDEAIKPYIAPYEDKGLRFLKRDPLGWLSS